METLTKSVETSTVTENEITLEMQEAFAEIGQQLIFTEKQMFPLSKENAKAISRQIQDEFIVGFDRNYFRMTSHFHSFIINLNIENQEKKYEEDITKNNNLEVQFGMSQKFSELRDKNDAKAYISSVLCYLWISGHQDDTWQNLMYKAQGCTPKLSFATKKHNILSEMNCIGYNIYIGSLCNRLLGIPTYFGIAPDHPFTFVEIEENTYIIDGQDSSNGIKRAKGEVLECDGYTIYYPRNKKEHRKTRMVFVHNFDDSVLYEILENLNALKQAAQGNVDVLLPTYRENVLPLVEENKDFLIKGEWRKMQKILFPEICRSLKEHARRWDAEVLRVRKTREKFHKRYELNLAWNQILEKAIIAAGWKGKKLMC